jgi:hypothetical protein
VLVPDAELLFTAQFHRAGPDLVLTGRDGAHHLVPGYFSSEHHPALVASNGAHLSPDTVDLLAGSAMPGHYAQAQPTAPPDSIGKIEKVVGDVSVVRNGVSVALHVGDAVFKSDVVQTGASASCGISFPDGTVLNLVANTRMALNDYAYDANSNSNGALFTLVEGTFAFVAGKVAHSGDMKIATPIATMGIRGTTGVVEEQPSTPATITAQAAGHTYTFAVVPDIGTGVTGMWDVFLTDANGNMVRDANGDPIVLVTVSQSGYVTYLTPQGLGQPPLVTTEPATSSQYAFEQEMLQQLFLTLNPANLNRNGNNGSSTPPPFELPNPLPQLFEDSGKPFTINVPTGTNPTTATVVDITQSNEPLTVVIWIVSAPGKWSTGSNWLGGAQPTSPQEVEILIPVKVTADGNDSAAGLVIVGGATVNVISGATLTIYDFIHGAGTIQLNSSGSDPTLAIDGAVTLVGGGTIKMIGTPGEDKIIGVPGTGALLINVDYTIEGTGTIGGGDGNLTFENFGTVNANDGLLTVNTGNQVYNDGLMEATAGGTLQIKDTVANSGTVQADGATAAVTLSGATFDNLFSVIAKNGGSITFTNVAVTNEAVSTTDPTGGTINATGGGTITFDGGSVANGNVMEATSGGILQLENIVVTNSGAGELIIDALSTLDIENSGVLGGIIDNAGNVVVTGSSFLIGQTVTNSGTITVGSGASLVLEGTTLTNSATGTIDADGGAVDIEINNANTTNSGLIEAVDGGVVIIDVNADGSGNYGTVEADDGMVVINNNIGSGDASGGNFGTIEAINGGTVTLNYGITNRAGATIEAIDPGSTVDFNEGQTKNLGTIEATGVDANVNFTDGMVDNFSLIIAENDGAISFTTVMMTNEAGATVEATSGGSIGWVTGGVDNFGTFEANGGTITFDGSIGITNEIGGVFEARAGGSIIFKTDGIGSVNNNGGMIEADSGGVITFDATLTGAQNSNGGIIEAEAGGTIIIDGFAGGNALFNGGGTIEAVGSGAKVELAGATIIGGNLETSAGGIIETISGNSTFDDLTIESGSEVKVSAGTSLTLEGTITDNGTIEDVAGDPDLVIVGTVTLNGSGSVKLDGTGADIVGAATGTNTLDNFITIEGAGQIGGGHLILDNELHAVIDANVNGATLTIDTGNDVTNEGTLEATGGGILLIEDYVFNFGSIVAGAGSTFELAGATLAGGTIDDAGTLSVTSSSAIDNARVDGGGDLTVASGATLTLSEVTLDDVTLSGSFSNSDTLTIDDTVTLAGATLAGGTIDDAGTLSVTSSSAIDNARVDGGGDLTVASGATLTLDADTLSAITIDGVDATTGGVVASIIDVTGDSTFTDVTVNNGDLTVEGNTTLYVEGTTTFDGVSVTDNGAIQVDEGLLTATLLLDDNATITGSGTLTINGLGTLDVETGADGSGYGATLDGVYVVDTGSIEVGQTSTGAMLTLEDGTTISGDGTLTINAGSTLDIAKGDVTLDGIQVIDNGTFGDISPGSGATLILEGGTTVTGSETGALVISDGDKLDIEQGCGPNHGATFDDLTVENAGTIHVDATLTIAGTVSFNDGGTVSMGSGSEIVGDGSPATLENVDNTIAGAGTIGGCGLTLNNDSDGTIDANVNGATLTLDTGDNTITNAGQLEASCGGTLDVKSCVDNVGGSLLATSGGVLDIEKAVYGGNATVDHGTLEFGGKSNVDVTFDNSHGYGVLTLDHAEDFCGSISGFTGTAADGADSDVIDLTDINFDSANFRECYDSRTGVLTITDGTHTAYLKFDDFYGTFSFSSDGKDGTDIYDPPAKDPNSSSSTETTPSGVEHALPSDQVGSWLDHAVVPTYGSDQELTAPTNLHTAAPTAPPSEHAVAPAIAASPTLASASFSTLGNDNFTFHPSLGSDTAQNTGNHTIELAHSTLQVVAPAPASIAPEFHQEFAFNDIHHDVANLAASVDQFHQMAASSTLLH